MIINIKNMTKEKQKSLNAFKKAMGTIKKVIEMTENDQYCIDIMQQNLAVIGLLKSAHQSLLDNHFKTCFKSKMEGSNNKKRDVAIEEVLKVVKIYNK